MSMFSKADYDYINLGACIRGQADRLGIEHEGIPLEGVVVRIAERALAASVVPEEPEWEYGLEARFEAGGELYGAVEWISREQAEEVARERNEDELEQDEDLRLIHRVVKRLPATSPGPWLPVEQEGESR